MAEREVYERFCAYASSRDAPVRDPSPEAAGSASAAAAVRAGHDPVVATGVCGIITHLLMLPTAAEASNLSSAYAAVLEQARLVHKELTGDMGPTLEPAPPAAGQVPAGEGGVAPGMAWVAGDADRGSSGMGVPPPAAAACAVGPAAPPSAMGPPVFHGGYAGVVLCGPASTPAEAAGHEARARAASRSLERPRPPLALPSSGTRGDDRERSSRGSALSSALAAAAAEAEAEVDARVSTDGYMPVAEPEADARVFAPPHSVSLRSPGSVGELWIRAAATAAILRVAIDAHGPTADVEAARADADAAQSALDAALAASVAAPVEFLPRDVKPIYKAPPPEAFAPSRAASSPLPEAGAAASSSGTAAGPAPSAGDDPAPPAASGAAEADPGSAAAIPVPETARAPAARRPSKGGKCGKEGDARRSFIESAFSQAVAGSILDGRGLAAPGYSGDARESGGSDI